MKRMIAIFTTFILLCSLLCLAGCGNKPANKAKGLDEYCFAVTYDEQNKVISAAQTVTHTNKREQAVNDLQFHVYASLYRQEAESAIIPTADRVKAYANGYSYGDISFDSVSVDNQPVAFTMGGNDCDILTVPLSQPLEKGDKITVQMVYQITLPNVWHRTGYGDDTVNLGNWYPVLCQRDEQGNWLNTPYYAVGDPFVSDMANYRLTVELPLQCIMASSGSVTAQEQKENTTVYTLQADAVRDFSIVLSNGFQTVTDSVGDIVVTYYYLHDQEAEQTLATAVSAIKYFNELIGQYPYDTLAVVETDFCFAGMEYSRLVYISDTLTQPTRAQTVVHEIAHQWFYGVIGSNQVTAAWQDEGLTEFCTALYFDAHPAYELTLEAQIAVLLANYTTYLDVAHSYLTNVNTAMNRGLGDYMSQQEYVYINYVKSCLMFYELYKTVGEAKFARGLKEYYKQCSYTTCTPQQLMACFSSCYGADLSEWFACYIEGKDLLAMPNNDTNK